MVAQSGDSSEQATIQLWDSGRGDTAAILNRETQSLIGPNSIDFSPDGRLLAVLAQSEIYVWELASVSPATGANVERIAAPQMTLRATGDQPRALAFSADSRQIYTVTGDSIVAWGVTARETQALGPDPMPLRFLVD